MLPRLLSATRLLGTTAVVTGLTLCGSLLNFVAQAILAYRFGASSAIDAYSYALSLPIFLSGLAGIIISYTAVPLMARAALDQVRARQIGRSLAGWMLAICAAIILLGIPAMFAQGHIVPPSQQILSYPALAPMIFLAWAAGGVQLLTALAAAQLNADGRAIVAATLGLAVSTGTILSLLIVAQPSITVAMTGLLCGSLLGAAAGLWLARSHLLPPAFSPEVEHEMAELGKSALWAVLALSCFASYPVIDAIWASRLGEGALAAMGYAHRLVIGIGGLVVAGPSAMFIPRLAKLVAAGDGAGFRRLLFRIIGAVGGLGLICAAGIFLFAQEIVSLLFQRGAFDSADSLLVATILRHMAPGVVAMLVSVMLLRAIFCLPGLRFISAMLGLLFSVSYFTFSWLMLDLGVEGLANAYSISWTLFSLSNIALILYKSRLAPASTVQETLA